MSSKNRFSLAMVVGVLGLGLVASAVLAVEPSSGGADGAKLVPLEIKAPRPMFTGTPKNIKPSPTLEKYSEKPRPPFLAPQGTKNLAAGKKVTSSDSAPIVGELSLVTDGDKEGSDGSFVELGPGTQWVQIDLGAPADIYAFVVWHYHAEGRVYHDVVIQVANDADFIGSDKEPVKTVFNNDFDNSSGLGLGKQLEYIDDYRGKLIDARGEKGQPVKGRYVRLYSKGNTSNDMNHYVEVEVFGKPAK
jgi:hypothetical protein